MTGSGPNGSGERGKDELQTSFDPDGTASERPPAPPSPPRPPQLLASPLVESMVTGGESTSADFEQSNDGAGPRPDHTKPPPKDSKQDVADQNAFLSLLNYVPPQFRLLIFGGIAFFFASCAVKLGVLPPSVASHLPLIGRHFQGYCNDCGGDGKKDRSCTACHGRGYYGGRTCTSCGGTGKQESACEFCGGSGKKPKP